MRIKIKENWHLLPGKDVLKHLQSSAEGLDPIKVKARLKKYGLNELPVKKRITVFDIFFRQFKSPLVYVLLGAAVITFLLHEKIDFLVICLAVAINVIIGFFQENKAENALFKLKQVVTPIAKVIRDKHMIQINADNLCIGDIVEVSGGDKVPADIRLLEVWDYMVNESSLTGESVDICKRTPKLSGNSSLGDLVNMSFWGTVCTKGRARGVVVATGKHTQLGKIALMIEQAKQEKTPLQAKLDNFSKTLVLLIVFICLLIIAIGLFVGRPLIEIFIMAVAIAVAAIPEGLVVGATAIMAIGMQRILRRNGLVRRLIAAETLGSTTYICTDKTGTLTEGKMKIVKVIGVKEEYDFLQGSYKNKDVSVDVQETILAAFLCTNVLVTNPDSPLSDWVLSGNSTEIAVFNAWLELNGDHFAQKTDYILIDEVPFGSEKKYAMSLRKNIKQHTFRININGAPEKIIKMSGFYLSKGKKVKITEDVSKKLLNKYYSLGKSGFRVIASGYMSVSPKMPDLKKFSSQTNEFIFCGLMAIKDPLRKSVPSSIKEAQKAGIKVVMITGDHKYTAMSIAQDLGLPVEQENVLEGRQIQLMREDEFAGCLRKVTVFARVSPRDKLRIVQTLQSQGEVVAMTGDGVNDAPALKAADIGVTVGSATEVCKETADLIILDNNFSTIVAAVEEGRGIFSNIRKMLLYLISDSFSEIVLISGALLVQFSWADFPMPLLAAQILWINLITDGFPNIALTLEPKEDEIMLDPPRKRTTPLLNKEHKVLIVLISCFTGLANLVLFYWLLKSTGDLEKSRTIIFAALGMDSLLYVFSCKSLRHNIWHEHVFSNKYLIWAVGGGILLQIMGVYWHPLQIILRTVALGIWDWVIVFLLSAVVILLIEITKYVFIVNSNKVHNT